MSYNMITIRDYGSYFMVHNVKRKEGETYYVLNLGPSCLSSTSIRASVPEFTEDQFASYLASVAHKASEAEIEEYDITEFIAKTKQREGQKPVKSWVEDCGYFVVLHNVEPRKGETYVIANAEDDDRYCVPATDFAVVAKNWGIPVEELLSGMRTASEAEIEEYGAATFVSKTNF